MERMEGYVEKREVSTGGNGREAESERLIPGRGIIGTSAIIRSEAAMTEKVRFVTHRKNLKLMHRKKNSVNPTSAA